jgi:hemin uptake protein HemP
VISLFLTSNFKIKHTPKAAPWTPVNQPQRQPEPDPSPSAPLRPAPEGPPICRSEELLQGGRLSILHQGELYHLRLTKSGKLLLTK